MVTAIDQECADVLSLTMQSPDGQALPKAMPGQYVVVRLHPAGGPARSLGGPRIGARVEQASGTVPEPAPDGVP